MQIFGPKMHFFGPKSIFSNIVHIYCHHYDWTHKRQLFCVDPVARQASGRPLGPILPDFGRLWQFLTNAKNGIFGVRPEFAPFFLRQNLSNDMCITTNCPYLLVIAGNPPKTSKNRHFWPNIRAKKSKFHPLLTIRSYFLADIISSTCPLTTLSI